MSSGQQPVTQQTTQTRDPWIGAQPALNQVQGGASALYNSGQGYTPYAGQTLADLDPRLSAGMTNEQAIAQANIQGTPGILASQGLGLNMIQNQGLSPQLQALLQQQQGQNNPYLEGTIRQGVNQANAAASGMGRYGSGAHDAAITQAMAPILSQDYARRQSMQQDILQQGLQRAGQWSQLMPTLDQAQYAPAQTLAALGQYGQDRSQQQLADQIKLYNAQQSWPWEQLARYSAIASGAGGLGGTQVTSAPLQQPSLLQSGLGGAAAGAGIGSIFGAPGAAVGAGAGSLLGLLGR